METQREVELLGEIKFPETALPRERKNNRVSQSGCPAQSCRSSFRHGVKLYLVASYSASHKECVCSRGEGCNTKEGSRLPLLVQYCPSFVFKHPASWIEEIQSPWYTGVFGNHVGGY